MKKAAVTLLLAVVLSGPTLPVRAQNTQTVVHAVLFWMNDCPHCHKVLDNVLPPLQEKHGEQLDILLIEVVDMDDVNRLYEVAAAYSIHRERVSVPFLIIGEQVLIGSQQIPDKLPGLIEHYLAQGGVERPSIPNLNEFLAHSTPTPLPTAVITGAVVRAILFTTLDCRNCQVEVHTALMPVLEKYGRQFEYRVVDVVNLDDVEYIYQVAETYGIPRQDVDLPLIIMGEQVLIGEQMAIELPGLVASHLATGGADWPSLPPQLKTNLPASTDADIPSAVHSNGFTLAIVVMAFMTAALAYCIIAFAIGKAFPLPVWADWLIPALIIIGIGVAGYLAYVETQSVEAMCELAGDCNTIHQSRYARLFDVLPVGVLGLLGYFALLVTWLVRRFIRKLEKTAAIGYFGMALFAVIFSLYLTFLEPFVIKAVCIWCLSSSIIVTLLLLLGSPPAIQQFTYKRR
jgi:uncharacterized membrane protein/glutaredoxin